MTLKLRAKVPFPASVTGVGGFKVSKQNGIWTIEPDFSELAVLNSIASDSNMQVWAFDPVSGQYFAIPFALLVQATSNPRVISTSGSITLNNADRLVIINKADGADIFLPLIGNKIGDILIVGQQADAHPFSIKPNGGDAGVTILGQASYPMNVKWQSILLRPYALGGVWVA